MQTLIAPNTEKKTLGTRTAKSSILVSSSKIFLLQGLGMLLAFGLQAFISRTCGASGVGGYALFISWLGILSIITVPGLEATLVFYLPRFETDQACRRKVIRICLIIVGALSSLAALALLVAGDRVFLRIGLPASARIAFVITIITFSFGKLLDALFLGLHDAPATSYFNVIRTILRIIFCLPSLFFPRAGWAAVLFSVTCEGFITLFLRIRKLRRQHPDLSGSVPARDGVGSLHSRQIVATAAPMFGISITDGLYPFLDKAILGAMLPLEVVGIYRISESIASLNSAFVSPFVSFWPYISKLYKENRMAELCDAYRSINLVIIALMVPFSLVLIEISRWILSLFGPVFALHGRTVLLILAFGCVVDAMAGPAGAVMKMTKHAHLSLYINSVLLVVYFALSLLLTSRYGSVGIATAKTFVVVLGNVTNVIANYLLLKIFPYSWKHAGLLTLGVLIFVTSLVLPETHAGYGFNFLVALGEFILFSGVAAIILKSHVRQIIDLARKWTTNRLEVAAY
jgi:O-antigen/teichoic acid export membrane protein